MCAGVSLQIKGVIESFATEGAEVALCVAVALHVTVQQPLEAERFGTEPALELARITFRPCGWTLFQLGWLNNVAG